MEPTNAAPDASSHVRLIGHRGAPRARTENTLPSFALAIEQGADAIELDVHATSDGVVVVHHDPVPRATRPDGAPERCAIAQLTWRDVAALDLSGERIPTLAETLELVGRRAYLYIEIKGLGIEREVVRVIEAAKVEGAVHSFDHPTIARVGALAPSLRRGLLFDEAVGDAGALLAQYGAQDLWPGWQVIDGTMVDAAHAVNARVIAWTVNDATVARRLVALGVDALCTDDLPAIRSSLASPAPATSS